MTVTNDGLVAVSNLATSGSSIASCNKAALGSLTPGNSLQYDCQKDNVNESLLEVITVTGIAGGLGAYQQTNDAFIKVSKPELIILKRPTTQTVEEGDTAFFSIAIRNEGTITLTNVKVLDPRAPDCGLDPASPLNLAPGQSREYTCRLEDVTAPVTTVATMQGTELGNGNLRQASDVAWVEMVGITAGLSSAPPTVDEPGTEVTFHVTVTNSGSVPVNLAGLMTDKYGNLLDPGNELVPATTNTCLLGPDPVAILPNGGSVGCDFVALVSGQPSNFNVTLTATAITADSTQATDDFTLAIPIVDIPPIVELNLSAVPTIVAAPGGAVTFTVRVTNLSTADGVVIDSLTDAAIGNLNGRGNCALPTPLIGIGGIYECAYSAQVNGNNGEVKTRTVTATGSSDDPVPGVVNASDSIDIQVSDLPVQSVFLPGAFMDGTVEPNNTCATAYPLRLGRQYFFLPPPTYVVGAVPPLQDYFSFEIEADQKVVVEMTNFAPRKGQLIVRDDSCADGEWIIVGQNANPGLNKTLDLGTQPAGKYFIQIINDGPPETDKLYGLIVKSP